MNPPTAKTTIVVDVSKPGAQIAPIERVQ